jgi:type IV secretory pathway VirB10-like protein
MITPNASQHDAPRSEVFDHLAAATPAVASQDRPWGFIAGLGGIGVLALIVFFSLSHARKAGAQSLSAPPPATLAGGPSAAAPPPPPAPPPAPVAQLPPAPEPPVADPSFQWRAPAMVVDLSQPQATVVAQATPAGAGSTSPAAGAPASAQNGGKPGSDEQFADRVEGAEVETAYATHLRDTALIAPQGTLISAILETGINSDLPGFVRAVVSRDVRGFDGSTVLIPRWSKLIGEYHNGVATGQSRAFVVWTRILTPDGISINLGSPAADQLGQAGLAGETNSHFLQRFGSAILFSVLTAGLQVAENNAANGNSASIVIGTSQQASSVAGIALQKDIDIPVTITVRQGTALRVFVARDLDFSGVMRRQR